MKKRIKDMFIMATFVLWLPFFTIIGMGFIAGDNNENPRAYYGLLMFMLVANISAMIYRYNRIVKEEDDE